LTIPGADVCPTQPSGTGVVRYVSAASGSDDNDGLTAEQAVASVGKAIQAAVAGDVIVIADGVYREGIETSSGGSLDAPLVIRAAPGADPVIAGSALATGWTVQGGGIWHTAWDDTAEPSGYWGPESVTRKPPQQVFVDGTPLQQIGGILPTIHPACPSPGEDYCREAIGSSVADLDQHPGSFFFDAAAKRLYVRLADDSSPEGHTVEVSQHRRVLYFYSTTPGHVCMEGLTFRHSNSSGGARQMAAVAVPTDSTLANSVVEWMDLAGVGLAERARIVRTEVRNMGQMGLASGAADFVIEQCSIHGNNYRRFNHFWEAGGFKIWGGTGGLIQGNHIFDNEGPGIWLDYAGSGFVIDGNYLHGNGREGQLMVEVSPGARVTNNIVHNDGRTGDPNVRGIYISESSDAFVAFNTVISTADSWAFQARSGSRGDFEGLALLGNIFASYASDPGTVADVGLAGPDSFTSDWNIYYRQTDDFRIQRDGASYDSLAAWQQAVPADANTMATDPNLVAPLQGIFEPAANSPAADKIADSQGLTEDHFRTARPRGPASDIGAIERCEAP
jgi:parallel beta-helix repeat protein